MFKTTFGKLSVGTQFSIDGTKVYYKTERNYYGSIQYFGADNQSDLVVWPTEDCEVMLYDYRIGERIDNMQADSYCWLFHYFDKLYSLTTDDANEIASKAASIIRDLLIEKLA